MKRGQENTCQDRLHECFRVRIIQPGTPAVRKAGLPPLLCLGFLIRVSPRLSAAGFRFESSDEHCT